MKNFVDRAEFSVCLWYSTGPTVGNFQRLLDFGRGAAQSNLLVARKFTANILYFNVYRGSSEVIQRDIDGSAFAPNGPWTHLCITRSASSRWRIYLNGLLTQDFTDNNNYEGTDRTINLIGESNWQGDAPYSGKIDEFRVYSRELPPADVSTLYAWRGVGVCYLCPVGSATAAEGQQACDACPPGAYASATGLTVCAPCPPGAFTGTTGKTVCATCARGTYADAPAQSACAACSAGKYLTAVGATAACQCTVCSPGTYATSGATTCAPCPAGTFAGAQLEVSECGLLAYFPFDPPTLTTAGPGATGFGPLNSSDPAPAGSWDGRVGTGSADCRDGGYYTTASIAFGSSLSVALPLPIQPSFTLLLSQLLL
jgi:hypothetical protein